MPLISSERATATQGCDPWTMKSLAGMARP
jgi:hypothetical protein